MRTRIVNITIATAALAFLVVLAFHVRAGVSADSVALLRTTGMTCENCSRTIARALQREQGVASTDVDVTGGWVAVGYDSKRAQPELLARKVSEAGYASRIAAVMTPEEFLRTTGRNPGMANGTKRGCCSGPGSCGDGVTR